MSESVTEWIQGLKQGRKDAGQKIWSRYYEQLVRIAHRKLGGIRRGAADEEDVAQEAFFHFFAAIEDNRFPRLEDRDDLWQVLLMLAERRARDRQRKELADRRGGGNVLGESAIEAASSSCVDGGIGMIQGRDPTPQTVDDLCIVLRFEIGALESPLTEVALDKLQGYENREIAERHNMSLRSVERKLHLIRRILNERSSS